MGDLNVLFEIIILDSRSGRSIDHRARISVNKNKQKTALLAASLDEFLNENNIILTDVQKQRKVDFLNENVDILAEFERLWVDLLARSVDETVRTVFRNFIRDKPDIPESPDRLFQLGDLSFWWKVNDGVVEITAGVVDGTSLADLFERFKLSHKGENEMVVTTLLQLQ